MDYHNNINVQMNYWPATSTNLLECFVPYIDYIRGLVKPGENTARDYWNARGWTVSISTNIFGFTAPLNSGDMTWNYNPSAGPWLASQIWEYYDYTRDTDWLRETGYPIIKSSADFASDLLYKNGDTYTAAPSYSPEHGQCDLGATYANAVTREILLDAIEAARILDTDQKSVKEWQSLLDSIAPYRIGSHGQLQEWSDDIDDPNDLHRHTNHLFGLHPGRSINAMTDTLLANAARQTLRERGDAATGWSMGWKLNHWARLFDGDHAYTLFKNLLRQGTADNLWDVHPPFQIDGNFGGTAKHSRTVHAEPHLHDQPSAGSSVGLGSRQPDRRPALLAEISKYRYMPAAAISTMRLSSQSKEVRARSPTADLRHRSTPSPATSYASQPTPKQAPSQRPPNADNYGLRDTAISASTNPQPCPAPPTRGMVFRYLRQNS